VKYFILYVLVAGNHPRSEIEDGLYVVGSYSTEHTCAAAAEPFGLVGYPTLCEEYEVDHPHM